MQQGLLRRAGKRWSVLGVRDFRLLYLAGAASWFGDEFFVLAVAFAALDLTGSVSAVGTVFAAEFAVLGACLLVGGTVADRVGRRRVMILADVARASTQAIVAFLLLSGQAELWHLVALAGIRGGASAFFDPASTGLVPLTVSGERLQEANALRGMTRSVCVIAGPVGAGLIVTFASSGAAIAVDAASFVLSALLLAAMRVHEPVLEVAESFMRSLAGGWKEFRSRTWLWAGVAQASLFHMVALAPFLTLGIVIARDEIGGPAAWSLVLAAFGAGTLLGGLVALQLRPRRPLVGALAASALYAPQMILLGLAAPVPLIALAALAGGAGVAFWSTVWETTLQQQVPLESLSRVAAYDWLGSLAFLPLGFALAGPAAGLFGAGETLWFGALLLLASVAIVLALPGVRSLRALDERPA